MSYKYGHGHLTKRENLAREILEQEGKTLSKCDEDMSYTITDDNTGEVILIAYDIEECFCAMA